MRDLSYSYTDHSKPYPPNPSGPYKNLSLALSRIRDMVAMVGFGATPEEVALSWHQEDWDNATLIQAALIKADAGYHPHLMQRFIHVWRGRRT
jgi:hypothetical protein